MVVLEIILISLGSVAAVAGLIKLIYRKTPQTPFAPLDNGLNENFKLHMRTGGTCPGVGPNYYGLRKH